jgi:3-hydroxymyristoyl/3-hydroxydecanoyl-(acyl carrier protein) dehydratase
LRSRQDLKFRNLGGTGNVYAPVSADTGTLTMRTRMTRISEAADMLIEDFDFQVLSRSKMIFEGHTNFGFFTAKALANQVGLRNIDFPVTADPNGRMHLRLEDEAPLSPDQAPTDRVYQPNGLSMPSKALRMIDTIESFDPAGGPHGMGYIRGLKTVDPKEWFFKAHFYQDPVCPGSLGVESFLQLIKYCALDRWPDLVQTHIFEPLTDHGFQWQYRGQIKPENKDIVVDAVITKILEQPSPVIMADGLLMVDGLCIYKMEGFGLRLKKLR